MMLLEDLKSVIRDVPDFPKEGIVFKDITTLLKDADAFHAAVEAAYDAVKDLSIDIVIGIESRGFILGPLLAYKLGKGFAPVRKKGKLPAKTRAVSYTLEYGEDSLEIHEDAISAGQRVLVVDDLLATGGTTEAVTKLVEELGGSISGLSFLIELDFLNGREKLKQYNIHSLIHY